MKKKKVISQVWTVSDMLKKKMRAIFGQLNLSLGWTDLDVFFFQTGQNFIMSLPISLAGWFGLACLCKSKKGDFLNSQIWTKTFLGTPRGP